MATPKYLCFTCNHDLEKALQTFRDRYHIEPKMHKYEYGILMVGPVPGSDEPNVGADLRVRPDEGNTVELRDQQGDRFQLIMF